MDAVKFVEERRRMYTLGCIKKGITDYNTKAEDVVAEVEAWSAAHPRKTRQSVFLEQWPQASIGGGGVLTIDSCKVEKSIKCNGMDCSKCRLEFCMQEVE